MLSITRKCGEGFWIGNEIHVCIVEVSGSRSRIAIHAPRDVQIRRDEIAGLPLPVPGGYRADDGSGASD